MAVFRKKPVEIEAMRYPGVQAAASSYMAFRAWLERNDTYRAARMDGDCLVIETLEGSIKAQPGDWIVQGVSGEVYPCKPDIFAETYEAV